MSVSQKYSATMNPSIISVLHVLSKLTEMIWTLRRSPSIRIWHSTTIVSSRQDNALRPRARTSMLSLNFVKAMVQSPISTVKRIRFGQ